MGLPSFTELKLTLPTLKPGEHLLVETRIEHLARWLKSQPYGNMAKTVAAVRRSIAGFNRTDVPLAARINGLALYDRSYQLIAGYYRPQSFRNEKKKETQVSIDEKREFFLLTQEMAYGYKVLATEYEKEKGPGHTLANILNLTLYYLSLVLMLHFDVYAPAPRNIWREIHNILGFSLHHDLVEKTLPQSAPEGCLETIERTYLRLTLVALANPYHLNSGQHWPIWRYLSHWVSLAELSEDPDDFDQDKTLIIDLHSDHRPYFSDTEEPPKSADFLLLLPEQLVRQVDAHLHDLKNKGKPPLPGFGSDVNATSAARLLEAMRYHWQLFKSRAAPRYQANSKIAMIIGVRNIHQELLQNDPLSHNKVEKITVPKSRWHTVNTSATGLCLNAPQTVRGVAVGQLVAVADEAQQDNYQAWKLGVVRWIQNSRSHGMTVGIELILGEIQAANIRILGIQERSEPGFLVSADDAGDRQGAPSLLHETAAVPPDRIVVLEIGDEELAVEPTRSATSTLFFERTYFATRALEDAYTLAQREIKALEEQKAREEAGEEVIEMTALPGFTQNTGKGGDGA